MDPFKLRGTNRFKKSSKNGPNIQVSLTSQSLRKECWYANTYYMSQMWKPGRLNWAYDIHATKGERPFTFKYIVVHERVSGVGAKKK
jgi:hypothetical protein